MSNRTFTIVKPDSVRKGNFGKIISRLESEGFKVLGIKKVALTQKQAEGFYAVHRERPFFKDLVKYMMSGPVYVAALERNDAVPALRKLMGATDPQKADKGTIRAESGEARALIDVGVLSNVRELTDELFRVGFQRECADLHHELR